MAADPMEAGVSEGTAQRRAGLAQGRGVQRARPGVLCPVAVPGHRLLPQLTANGTGPGAAARGCALSSAGHWRGSARQASGSFSGISARGRAKGRVGAPLSNPRPAPSSRIPGLIPPALTDRADSLLLSPRSRRRPAGSPWPSLCARRCGWRPPPRLQILHFVF